MVPLFAKQGVDYCCIGNGSAGNAQLFSVQRILPQNTRSCCSDGLSFDRFLPI
jgi:hypothetical protein